MEEEEEREEDGLLRLWLRTPNAAVAEEEVGENRLPSPPSVLSEPGERGKPLPFGVTLAAKLLCVLPVGIGVGPVPIPSSVGTRARLRGLLKSEGTGVESLESPLMLCMVRSVNILAGGELWRAKELPGVAGTFITPGLACFFPHRDIRRRRTDGLMFETFFGINRATVLSGSNLSVSMDRGAVG